MKILDGKLAILKTYALNVFAADDDRLYASRGYTLYQSKIVGELKFDKCIDFPSSLWRRLLSRSRLVSRALRLGIRNIFCFERFTLVIVDTNLYRIGKGEVTAELVHVFRQGVPLRIEGCDVSNEYYFGTYDTGKVSEPTRIFASGDGRSWEVRYEFRDHPVRHVHGIFSSQFDGALVACTGDSNDESKILLSRDGCRTFEVIAAGNQYARVVSVAFIDEMKLLVASDSPDCQNYVYLVDLSARDQVLVPNESWRPIDASCFYLSVHKSRLIVSTVPERSQINQTNQVSIYVGDASPNLRRVASFSRDLLFSESFRPYLQHPSARIVNSPARSSIFFSCTAVKGFDGCSVEVDIGDNVGDHTW